MTIPPLLFALLMWFMGTAAIVWLDSRPRETFKASFILSSFVAIGATIAIWLRADDASGTGAYVAFAAAILIWGWHEMGFLMGFVAGPNRAPLPTDIRGWPRFRLATATVIHHEIALAATALALFALTWGQPNQAAPLTFLLLFAARLSAKLNLFLGVANLSDEVFPEHLAYLKSYFGMRAFNPLFPVSILLGVVIAAWAWITAEAATGGTAVTATLIAGLAVLAIVEHLFLVLPLKDGAMWRWASNTAAETAPIPGGEARHGS